MGHCDEIYPRILIFPYVRTAYIKFCVSLFLFSKRKYWSGFVRLVSPEYEAHCIINTDIVEVEAVNVFL
jgi:hypothetical protein